jgi:hypothetical protein
MLQDEYPVGTWVVVPYGAGRQIARIVSYTRKGLPRVKKWRDNSRRFTNETTLQPLELLGSAGVEASGNLQGALRRAKAGWDD